MNIGINQKKIIDLVSKDLKEIENSDFNSENSAGAYFALWARCPGFEKLNYRLSKGKNIISLFSLVLKDIISISKQSKFIAHKDFKENKNDYENLIVSWASRQDFEENGTYCDRYFKINSKNFAHSLFFLIYNDDELPVKIDSNIIILKRIKYKYKYNLFFLIKYILIKAISSKFSIKRFFHSTSSYTRLAEVVSNIFREQIDLKKIKSIIMPYEAQPFQQAIFLESKKINKNIVTIGYDHSAPQSIPVHLYFRKGAPDFLLVNGPSQAKHISENLNWPKEKIKIVPSARYQKNDNFDFNNKIFLPYEIFDKKVVLKEFENFLKNVPKQSLNRLLVKNHPTMKNSTNHLDIQTNLDKIILQYEDRFSKEKLSKNISVFIGPTTGAIVALEKELKVFHICFNSILESYSEKLWPMLTVNQLSTNMFEYNLKKRGEFILFGEEKNNFQKYYSY